MKAKKSLISIIIPVYNVEKYLRRCLDSVTRQTYKNIEIILIDDGSTDSSGIICDEYKEKDERIIVIHQKNKGLSEARNAGLKIFKGNYVTFIDSDDYVNDEYIKYLYNLIRDYKSDIAIVGYQFVFETDFAVECKNICEEVSEYTYLGALETMLYQENINNSAWGKLLKRDVVSNIFFPSNKLYEDVATTYRWFLKSKKIVVSNLPYYYYTQRSNAISKTFSSKSFDMLEMVYQMEDELLKKEPSLNKAIDSRVINAEFFVLRQISKKDYPNEYQKLKFNIKQRRKNVLFDSKVRLKTRIGILLSYINFNLIPIFYGIMKNRNIIKKLD